MGCDRQAHPDVALWHFADMGAVSVSCLLWGKADIRQNSRNVCLLGYHHVLRHHGNGVWLERDDFLGTRRR